ncbi:MAG: UDP-glucose 6-dehydrogenase, partial [Nocardioidaceae bacterium]|nr:UDP-glucose 6-dehydrogenase [Nocardioidaceae bacterium]
RDSPALDIAFAILQGGAAVRVYDPYAMDNARIAFPPLASGASAIDACQGADVVLHLTEWKEFKHMHPSALSEVVAERRIIDGRNTLDRELWSREGWTHRALGRTSI